MTQCRLTPTTEDRAHHGICWECRLGVGGSPLAYEGCNVTGMSAEGCISQATRTRSCSLSHGSFPEPSSPT